MTSFLANWKTSASGILMVAMGVGALFGVKVGTAPVSPDAAIAMIVAGIGLVFAKDKNVTGGTTPQ